MKGFYYMRLHGRNAAQWWTHEKSEDRYNYLYSADGAEGVRRDGATRRARLVKKAYLYTNNHFSAKSVANAAMIKQQLGEPLAGEYPPEFVERYPGSEGPGQDPAAYSFTYSSSDHVAALRASPTTSIPVDDLAEHGVLAVELRRGARA